MLNIITDDKRLDFVLAEITKEIKDAEALCDTYKAEQIEKGLYVKGGVIGYSDLRSFARAISIIAERRGESDLDVAETPKYDTLGPMADVSRNAVMTVESVKKLCRISAIEGFNALMLYTEDTYEIEGYPYFGHLRGRYSAEELREIDDYAYALGIEVIPCIQTLAHLNAIFEWPAHSYLRDCDDIMLAGDERVYELVDKMLETMSKNLRSRRINLGLDEAFMLGRGKYVEKNGYSERSEIMGRHLARVTELCKKHGYAPRMWSDMFFRMINNGVYRVMGIDLPQYIIDSVPPEPVLVYWEYIQTHRENYNEMFRQHKAFKNNKVAFAGGDASWYGIAPLNKLARNSTLAAVKAIEDNDCREIYVTMWGDDGGEASFFSTLTTLFIYGEACWGDADTCDARSQSRLGAVLGVNAEDMLNIENINGLPERTQLGEIPSNPIKYILYENILMGKFDLHIPDGTDEHFAAQAAAMKEAAKRAGEYAYIYESLTCLCEVLALKAEMGKRIHAAYHAGDRDTVAKICREEIPELEGRIIRFHEAFRAQWQRENKNFGFDVQDIRLGGLIGHLRTAAYRLESWLSGDVKQIDELEAPRLEFLPKNAYGADNGILQVNRWQHAAGQNLSNCNGI